MNDILLVIPIALPLFAAGASLVVTGRPQIQRTIGVTAISASLITVVMLLFAVRDGSVIATRIGGWDATVGITLVADPFSALLATISSVVVLSVLIFAIASPRSDDIVAFFHPVYLVLAAGVSASFLTADLFNLFVAFEITLCASYVLITLANTKLQIRHGMTYVVISLLASTLFITGVALIYAATGTVSLAELSGRLGDVDPALRTALGGLFIVVFGVKAAIFPLFFWLPDSYPTAPAPVTAIFAGLLTKMGVYAIIRTQTLIFGEQGQPSVLLLALAGLTMLAGSLGALAQNDIKRILSFQIIAGIGFMVFGLGLFSLAGITATVFYMAHHIVVMTTLFLVDGLIEQRTGTGAISRLAGMLHTTPFIAVLFLLPALSLASIPPFTGFLGKVGIIQAGLADGAYLTVTIALVVSLFIVISMTRIWAGVFWGDPPEPDDENASEPGYIARPVPGLMTGAATFLVALSLAMVVVAGPIHEISERAAEVLLVPTNYITAVLGP